MDYFLSNLANDGSLSLGNANFEELLAKNFSEEEEKQKQANRLRSAKGPNPEKQIFNLQYVNFISVCCLFWFGLFYWTFFTS